MKSIYIEMNIPKMIAAKLLGKINKNSYLSKISPVVFSNKKDPPLPDDNYIRVRNKVSTICASDLHLLYLDVNPEIAPAVLPGNKKIYLGHELCGEVIEVGKKVKTIKVGDKVTLDKSQNNCIVQGINPPCIYCKNGNYSLCENQGDIKNDYSAGGGWSDTFIAHESQVYKAPKEFDDEEICLIEPASVGVRAVLKSPPIKDNSVLVVGCGVIGLFVIQALKALTKGVKIYASAKYPFQMELAKKYGADEVFLNKDLYEITSNVFNKKIYTGMNKSKMILGGFDIIYDCIGNSKTITDSLRCVRALGKVVMVGLKMDYLKVDLNPIWYREVNLTGIFAHGRENYNNKNFMAYDLVSDLFKKNKLTKDGIITHKFKLLEWKKAVKTFSNKKKYNCIKAAFVFD